MKNKGKKDLTSMYKFEQKFLQTDRQTDRQDNFAFFIPETALQSKLLAVV